MTITNPVMATGTKATGKVLTCVLLVAILIQSPLVWLFWPKPGAFHLVNVLIHGMLLAASLRYQLAGHSRVGRRLLVISILSYLCMTNLLWPPHLDLHYYFLMAIVFLPFLYAPWEARSVWLFCAVLAVCFIVFDEHALTLSVAPHYGEMHWIRVSTPWLLLACVLGSTYVVRIHTSMAWVKSAREGANLSTWLNRIMPAKTRQLLASADPLAPRTFGNATVLIADLQGYTQLSNRLTESQLCAFITGLYQQFDTLCEQHELQKIKTNGDEYIAVAGLDSPMNAALNTCSVAGKMQCILASRLDALRPRPTVALRVGIATGGLCAGVQVRDYYRYDIWGDTVNLAAELEATCQSGKVQICASTERALNNQLETTKRGTITLKSRAPLTTYWLSEGMT